MLLANAYGVRNGLIFGIPSSISGTRWDISAKIVDPDPALKDRHLTEEQDHAEYRARVLSILSECFHLKAHLETKDMPVLRLDRGERWTLQEMCVPVEMTGKDFRQGVRLAAYAPGAS